MSSCASATAAPRRAVRRRARALSALAAAAATVVAGSLAGVPTAAAAGTGYTPGASDLTMVQANLRSALSVERFQSDVREVLAQQPDVITYNEVPLRQDSVIAPAPYAVYRSHRNRYTAATAVAWRADRWTMIDSGTFRVSNYRKIPPRRHIKLGLRFANWVTLESDDGRELSVVAAHVAPRDKNLPDGLLRHSVTRLGRLTDKLAPRGPVLMGGDFNVHYKSGLYPRDLFDAAGLVPTYDTLASYFPTGDHRGATIDYVFNRGADLLGAAQHTHVELYSDHDAVVAGLDWLTDTAAETQRVVSDPDGDGADRRRAVAALVRAIHRTQPGEELEVVTSQLTMRVLFRRLKGAVDRGVHVRLTTRSRHLTRRERGLTRVVAASGDDRSVVRRCRHSCLRSWRQSRMWRGFLLRRDTDGDATLRVDVSRIFDSVMVQRRTRVVSRVGAVALDTGEDLLDAVY